MGEPTAVPQRKGSSMGFVYKSVRTQGPNKVGQLQADPRDVISEGCEWTPTVLSLLFLFPPTDGSLSSYTLKSWMSSDLARALVHRAKPALGRIPDTLICKLITGRAGASPRWGDVCIKCTVNLLSGLDQKSKTLVFKCQPQTSSLKEAAWGWQGRSL